MKPDSWKIAAKSALALAYKQYVISMCVQFCRS